MLPCLGDLRISQVKRSWARSGIKDNDIIFSVTTSQLIVFQGLYTMLRFTFNNPLIQSSEYANQFQVITGDLGGFFQYNSHHQGL